MKQFRQVSKNVLTLGMLSGLSWWLNFKTFLLLQLLPLRLPKSENYFGAGSSTKHQSFWKLQREFCRIVFIDACLLIFAPLNSKEQQINDSSFNTIVEHPAYRNVHPRVLIDAAHFNLFSTITNRIEPLTKLLSADGYQVDTITTRLSKRSLSNYQVLIILTAQGGPPESDSTFFSAFTDSEIEALYNWINNGGAILFGIDHSPYNYAGEKLLKRLAVGMSFGVIEDSVYSEAGIENGPDGRQSTLVFSRENGLLGNHPIINGRRSDERIKKMAVSSGEAIKGPKGSSVLLQLSSTAFNGGVGSVASYRKPVGTYSASAVAFKFGKGRVVITADCSMWTAQLVTINDKWTEFGMARKDLDNRQFALNVMHWLSHLIN
jgi:hypothetical protein